MLISIKGIKSREEYSLKANGWRMMPDMKRLKTNSTNRPYMGDIHPSERSFKKGSQYANALNEAVKAGDALIGTLTEKQKEQFEAYMTAQREVNVLTDCETFCYAFKLGAKTMMDVLTDEPMKEL